MTSRTTSSARSARGREGSRRGCMSGGRTGQGVAVPFERSGVELNALGADAGGVEGAGDVAEARGGEQVVAAHDGVGERRRVVVARSGAVDHAVDVERLDQLVQFG